MFIHVLFSKHNLCQGVCHKALKHEILSIGLKRTGVSFRVVYYRCTGVPAGIEAFKPKHIEIIYKHKKILK